MGRFSPLIIGLVILLATLALRQPVIPPDEVADWGKGKELVLGESSARSCPGISFLDILLDKDTSVPTDYVPLDLVAVDHQLLRSEAVNQLVLMREDLTKTGQSFLVYSGFRPATTQASLYQQWTKVLGVNSTLRAAPPGHSEHQLGTAVDLVLANSASIYPSKAWDWLSQNAYKYGFVMSYGENFKQTDYQFEPWHWRFIGVPLATKIRQSSDSPQKFYRKISCS